MIVMKSTRHVRHAHSVGDGLRSTSRDGDIEASCVISTFLPPLLRASHHVVWGRGHLQERMGIE